MKLFFRLRQPKNPIYLDASYRSHIGRPSRVVSGETGSLETDDALDPSGLVAITEQVYETPLVSPETVMGEEVPEA